MLDSKLPPLPALGPGLVDHQGEAPPAPSAVLPVATAPETNPFSQALLQDLALQPSNIAPLIADAMIGRPRALVPDGASMPASPSLLVAKLPYTEYNSLAYKDENGLKLSFFASLFSGAGKIARFGVVQYAMRYRIDSGKKMGVIVRLAAAVESWDASISLTLPNLAATGQLSHGRTRIGITVAGYTGAFGGAIPDPADFTVENYAEFLQRFAALKSKVIDSPVLGDYQEVQVGIA